MSNLDRIERTSAHQRRALRRAERENLLRVIGEDEQMDTPDAAVIAVSSREGKQNDPRGSL